VDPRTALGLAGVIALMLVGHFRRRASDPERRRERDGSAFAGDGGSCAPSFPVTAVRAAVVPTGEAAVATAAALERIGASKQSNIEFR
jgi:hypothetical protein